MSRRVWHGSGLMVGAALALVISARAEPAPLGSDDTGAAEALHRDGLTLIVVTHDPQVSGHAGHRLELVDGTLREPEPAVVSP